MYQKVKSLVSGYKLKKIKLHQVEITLSYYKKFQFLDPISPLKELQVGYNNSNELEIDDSILEQKWEGKLECMKYLNPTHVAKFAHFEKKYEVRRFVTKEGKKPMSIYSYLADDKLFGVFTRRYDYGEFYQKKISDLKKNYDLENNNGSGYLLKSHNLQAYFNYFGHSHSFLWNDRKELESCMKLFE